MRNIMPNTLQNDAFVKCFYKKFYLPNRAITAIAIAKIDATDLSVSINKGCPLLIVEISLCGWCFVQVEDQYGFFPCQYIQLQQETRRVPPEYLKQFCSSEKKSTSAVDYKPVNIQWSFFSVKPSAFQVNAGLDGYDLKQPLKNESKVRIQCKQCGVDESPIWRSGPSGAKSLCNACGLMWYKKQKGLEKEKNLHIKEKLAKATPFMAHYIFEDSLSAKDYYLQNASTPVTLDTDKKKRKKPSPKSSEGHDDKPNNKLSISFLLS